MSDIRSTGKQGWGNESKDRLMAISIEVHDAFQGLVEQRQSLLFAVEVLQGAVNDCGDFKVKLKEDGYYTQELERRIRVLCSAPFVKAQLLMHLR